MSVTPFQAMAEYGKSSLSSPYCKRRSDYSKSDLAFICKKFPELTVLPEPGLDDLIQVFLAQHDVHLSPPGGASTFSNMFIGAVTGYAGLAAGGILKLEKNQRDLAAKQEWTSWKQWAISHADWESFRPKAEKDIAESRDKALALWNDEAMLRRVALCVEERDAKKKKEKLQTDRYFLLAVLGLSLLAFIGTSISKLEVSPSKDDAPLRR